MAVLEDLSEDESYLFAILEDQSGLDLAEFCWFDPSIDDGCWRAWPFQWPWWRCTDTHQIDLAARSIGKSLSIKARMYAFPFRKPGQEALITAPELIHLEPIIDLIEEQFYANRLGREMLPKGRSAITHRPFLANFRNGARIMGRIPQRDGRGVKGCVAAGTPVLTAKGFVLIEDLREGDLVLTHRGAWRPVLRIEEDVNDCYEVRGQGSFPLEVSCDHRFFGAENLATPKQTRRFDDLGFHDVSMLLDHKVYWATPTKFPPLPIPQLDGPAADRIDLTELDTWWLVGRYLADGVLVQNGKTDLAKVCWYCPEGKAEDLELAGKRLGLHIGRSARLHSSADELSLSSRALARWLSEHFGRHADGKRLPAWALGMPYERREALLDGYLAGDGYHCPDRDRWEVGTASKLLATGVQLLAQSLGYSVNCGVIQPKVTHIMGTRLKNKPQLSWRLQITSSGIAASIDDVLVGKVKQVLPIGKRKIYNPIVDDHHSYVSGAIISHNVHPLQLELDEGQDFSEPGFVELTETLKRGFADAEWRTHGVTKGVHGKFWEFTQENSGWTVHHLTAVHRPNFTDEERQEKIQKYGGHRDDPDFRRNIYGEHGDQTSLLFVLPRLMKCVDDDRSSPYNMLEYKHLEISDSMIDAFRREGGDNIAELLTIPEHHRDYGVTWCGMDVGLTADPTEILVVAEHHLTKEDRAEKQRRKKACPKEGESQLKLILRLSLKRVTNPDQITFMLAVIDFYKPQAFALDRTGIGLPLYQDLQNLFRQAEETARQVTDPGDKRRFEQRALDLRASAKIIKGYNFSEKVIVDIDEQVKVDEDDGDLVRDAGMARNVLEHSTDLCRKYVDTERFWLPWDRTLISEYEGQTVSYSKAAVDQFGRRRRTLSKGKFHAFDATRMLAMAHGQQTIEAIVNRPDEDEPVLVIFGDQF